MDICGDNRFEIIARAKEHLLNTTNIHTSKDEMKVLDDFLFRCWQMGWLDRYDRKTENSSEKPNNCDDLQDWKDRMWAEAIVTEPTISKMEQVETMSCQECKRWIYDDRWGWFCPLKSQDECKYEPKDLEQFRVGLEYHTDTTHFGKTKGESVTTNKIDDEPQTDCAWRRDEQCSKE